MDVISMTLLKNSFTLSPLAMVPKELSRISLNLVFSLSKWMVMNSMLSCGALSTTRSKHFTTVTRRWSEMFMPKWLALIIITLMALAVSAVAIIDIGFIFLLGVALVALFFWAMISLMDHYS